jgi:hypothetical protein
VLVDGEGVDCLAFWLFDATTGALVALGDGCNEFRCTEAAPGFQFPLACFPGNPNGIDGTYQNLCLLLDAGPIGDAAASD